MNNAASVVGSSIFFFPGNNCLNISEIVSYLTLNQDLLPSLSICFTITLHFEAGYQDMIDEVDYLIRSYGDQPSIVSGTPSSENLKMSGLL
jgi:hypothetical protein